MTYGQFMDTVYIPAYETEVEESTFYVRKRTLESMRDRFSNIELRSLAVEDVQRYRTWLLSDKGAGYSQAYASLVFGMFRKSLDMAVDMQYLEVNVSKKVKAIPKGKAVVPYWTKKEFEKVISVICLDDAELTGKKHIITSSIEHKAVLETTKHLQQLGFEVDYIDPERDGRVLPEKVFSLLQKDTLLVSIMHVNNETGAIQPVQEIGDFLLDKDVFFHVDATQSFGKLVDELRSLKYDMLSMSAHKLGGPQGIGALILRKKRYKLPPVKNIMYGGPQEHGIRPGTTPVALVAGLGKACELAATEYKENAEKCFAIRNCLLHLLKESGASYRINGDLQYCSPNTLSICFDGVSSEALMLATKQYCGISNGSACNSHSYSPSYVLTAMGLPEEQIESSIRVSWGPLTDIQLVQVEFGRLLEYVKNMQ